MDAEAEPHDVGLAGHQVFGAAVGAGRMDADQDLVVCDGGSGDVGESEDLGFVIQGWVIARIVVPRAAVLVAISVGAVSELMTGS